MELLIPLNSGNMQPKDVKVIIRGGGELLLYALTLLGPSEGVPTSLRSARSTPTAHRGNALCACRLGKVDNSSKVA